MKSKISSRIGRMAAEGLVLGSLSLGLLAGPGAAQARDNESVGGTPCVYGDTVYAPGDVIKIGDKSYKCFFGMWVETEAAVSGGQVNPQALSSSGKTFNSSVRPRFVTFFDP
jgi:hypothetical protein